MSPYHRLAVTLLLAAQTGLPFASGAGDGREFVLPAAVQQALTQPGGLGGSDNRSGTTPTPPAGSGPLGKPVVSSAKTTHGVPGAIGLLQPPTEVGAKRIAAKREGWRLPGNRILDQRQGEDGSLRILRGPLLNADLPDRSGRDPLVVAREFLRQAAERLGLEDPDQELNLLRQRHDVQGRTHLRLQQVHQHLPIQDHTLGLHLDANNDLYLLLGHYLPTPQAPVPDPLISAEDAVIAALLAHGEDAIDAPEATPEQVLLRLEDDQLQPAWRLRLALALDDDWTYFISTQDGRLLERRSNLRDGLVNASGTDLQGINRGFNAWQQNGKFYLIDPSTPTPDASYDPLNEGPKTTGDFFLVDFKQTDGVGISIAEPFYPASFSQTTGWDPAAVSAAWNVRKVHEYFRDVHGRNGIDNAAQNLLVGLHFQSQYNNAFWNGTWMVFGDGDGETFTNLAGCLDVAAHEMSHGVIGDTAALVYRNQPGALNESIADVLGVLVDRDDWRIGEECTVAAPGHIRDLQTPASGITPQPSRMSEFINLPNNQGGDWGGVHINSGIPNQAAYQVAESIGRDALEAIWYRALDLYLHPLSGFIEARTSTLQAAEDLYGVDSNEALAVAAAWDLVEVEPGFIPEPSDTTPNSAAAAPGADNLIYLYPADGYPNDPYNEPHIPFFQTLPRPFNGFSAQQNQQLTNVRYAYWSRPAVWTDQYGTHVLFIGTDHNIYRKTIGDNNLYQYTNSGNLLSIAISPDGRQLAYVTDDKDNHIYVLDFDTGQTRDFTLVPSDYQENGSASLSTIYYPDAIAFDYLGRYVAFDALHCVDASNSPCSPASGGYRYWSIGILDLATNRQLYPFTGQSPDVSIGFPTFASNNHHLLLADHEEPNRWRQLSIDFSTGAVTTLWDYGANRSYGIGSFWGGDDHISLQLDGGIWSLALNPDGSSDPDSATRLNPYFAGMPLMHRSGVRDLSGSLLMEPSPLDFGSVPLGNTVSRNLTLTNDGTRDLEILSITSDSAEFTHNGSPLLLPIGAQIALTLKFSPVGISGSHSATLTLTSDATQGSHTLNLIGTATNACGPYGADRQLQSITLTSGQTLACSASASYTLGPLATLQANSDLSLTAPRITLKPGVQALSGSRLRLKTK